MIRAHRQRHRIAFLALAVVLPLVLALAIRGRRVAPLPTHPTAVTAGAEGRR